jgi:hypothetical protein
MVTASKCLEKYGPATSNNRWLTLWIVPEELHVGWIPKKIYLNKDLIKPLSLAFLNLIERGLVDELKSWDGCFNIRAMRGQVIMSLHSWAIAVDVNAKENPMGKKPKLSAEFVKCFTDVGFDWGGNWHRPDGMHFQLAAI